MLMLQSKRKDINVNYLADYFGVSRRTIFRDLSTIQEMEVPIAYHDGEGYSIPRGYNIPPLMFSAKEIATIMVGLSFAKSQQDAQMVNDAQAVELKIQNVVPLELRTLMNTLDEKLVVDPYLKFGAEKNKGGDWFTVANAISNKNIIRFEYADGKERILHPYLLVYFSDHWNVIGLNEVLKELRNYKIDVIENLMVSGNNFDIPKEYEDTQGLIFRSDGDVETIIVRVSKDRWEEFKRSVPSVVLSAKTIGETIECTFKFDNLVYINEWLLRYGDSVNVLSPNALVDIRRALLNEMMQRSNT